MKKIVKKLSLGKETLDTLTGEKLARVAGGLSGHLTCQIQGASRCEGSCRGC